MSKKILLVAGGTGGHMLPAISFGTWLNLKEPDYTVRYITGIRSLEREIYQSYDITPITIDLEGSPIGVSFKKSLKRWGQIINSFFQAGKIMHSEKPAVCILFGGYISLPILLICKIKRIPVLLHEQNSHAGRVTRIAAKLRVPILSGWQECAPFQRGEFREVGIPVRAFTAESKTKAWEILQIKRVLPVGPIVVVFSGSLGSDTLRTFVSCAAKNPIFSEWTFVVLGPEMADEGTNVITVSKRWDIAPLYQIADVVITRAGASTLSELMLLKIPALVVPWMNSVDGHQLSNARLFVKNGYGLILDEKEKKDADFHEKLDLLLKKCDMSETKIDQSMYNKVESICEKLWHAVLSVI